MGTDPSFGHPQRDQSWLLSDWLCAVRLHRVPYFKAQVEDGQGDRRQENGGPPLIEVKRNGRMLLCASAAPGVRHLQELRGSFTRCIHGWQWCCDAWKGHLLRAEGRRR